MTALTRGAGHAPPVPAGSAVGSAPLVAVKPSSTTRNNTVVQAADPHLVIAAIPVGTYIFDGYLPYDATTTGDMKISVTAPAGSLGWNLNGPPVNTTNAGQASINRVVLSVSSTPAPGGGGAGTPAAAMPVGTLVVSTTGTLTLLWAQNAQEVSDCILLAGAWIRLTRIA